MLPARSALIALGFALAAPTLATADTYTLANFSGGAFGGNANVQSPFAGNGFVQGMTFTGSFLQDDNMVPAPGSGFVNVLTDFYPDAAIIPADIIFQFNFGPLTFTAADNNDADLFGGPYVQYNNGHFNGFVLEANFDFQSNPYQLMIQGGSLSVHLLSGGFPTGSSLINGFINIGDGAVTGGEPFVPIQPGGGGVPEPAAWTPMIVGLGGAGAMLRRARTGARA
jgi:hypothetical protein